MSNSARRSRIAPRRRITAPSVPRKNGRRHRDEVREGDRHPVKSPHRVVAELVHTQDPEQRGRERQAHCEPPRVLPQLLEPNSTLERAGQERRGDRGEEQPEMDERARRLGHLGLRERVHPHRALVLPEERRVPVAREARPQAVDRHLGLHEEASSEGDRASDEPTLLDDEDVVELAPQERLEREQLFPARGLFGGAARPERHVTILRVSLSRRPSGSRRRLPVSHQPADERPHRGEPAREVEGGHHGLERGREHRLLLPSAVLRLPAAEAETRIHPQRSRPGGQAARRDDLRPPYRQATPARRRGPAATRRSATTSPRTASPRKASVSLCPAGGCSCAYEGCVRAWRRRSEGSGRPSRAESAARASVSTSPVRGPGCPPPRQRGPNR